MVASAGYDRRAVVFLTAAVVCLQSGDLAKAWSVAASTSAGNLARPSQGPPERPHLPAVALFIIVPSNPKCFFWAAKFYMLVDRTKGPGQGPETMGLPGSGVFEVYSSRMSEHT